ncbi:MAG: hypothetical protein WCP29_14835 [Acidobacteriota bacterium]
MTYASFPQVSTRPINDSDGWPPEIVGQARIIDMAFHGQDLMPLVNGLTERARSNPHDAAALMDLASIHIVLQKRAEGLALQADALGIEQVYRQPIPTATRDALRLLMFVGPGDFMANIPVQFLLEGANVSLDLVYLVPGQPVPARIPEHDLAIVGVGEADESRPILEALSSMVGAWPTRVLLDPGRVAQLSRDSLWKVLADAPGVVVPATVRLDRGAVADLAHDDSALASALPGWQFPIIVRPVGSHAGLGLERVNTATRLAAYVAEQSAERFYLSPFVDYRNVDGLYRKYRVAFVDGCAFPCHAAMADHWMLHYLNAGMEQSAAKRADEERWFATFDDVFAARHHDGFRLLHERIGLEYFVIDCAEMPGGDLLVFEADTAMIIHAMDSPTLFPYKAPNMRRAFDAFQTMLFKAAGRPTA